MDDAREVGAAGPRGDMLARWQASKQYLGRGATASRPFVEGVHDESCPYHVSPCGEQTHPSQASGFLLSSIRPATCHPGLPPATWNEDGD